VYTQVIESLLVLELPHPNPLLGKGRELDFLVSPLGKGSHCVGRVSRLEASGVGLRGVVSFVGCVMDNSPNAPPVWVGALRWRDNTPYCTQIFCGQGFFDLCVHCSWKGEETRFTSFFLFSFNKFRKMIRNFTKVMLLFYASVFINLEIDVNTTENCQGSTNWTAIAVCTK
jgi:hypothetical protein